MQQQCNQNSFSTTVSEGTGVAELGEYVLRVPETGAECKVRGVFTYVS